MMRRSTKGYLGSSGFTMTELLMVSIVIAILMAIAIPVFSVWMPSYRLKQAARDLYSTIQSVKMAAVKNNNAMNVSFSTAPEHQYEYNISGVTKTVRLSEYGSGVRFQNHDNTETFTAAPSPLTFDGRGFTNAPAANFFVYLSNQQNTGFYRINLVSTGALSLEKWDGASYK